jgi:hypothetical protein
MSDEKKPEATTRPMRHNLKPEHEGAPRTSTLTFEPENRDSVEAAMRILKQARADIEAAERAKEAEAAKK